jgi:hypothetical protein
MSKLWHIHPMKCYSFVCLAVREFELRNLDLLCRCSTTWSMSLALLALFIFETGSHILCPGQPGMQSLYLCIPHSWNFRQVLPYSAFIGWDGVLIPFDQTCLKPQSSQSISASRVAGITGMSHHTWLLLSNLKKIELLIHAIPWINFKIIMLSEKSQRGEKE